MTNGPATSERPVIVHVIDSLNRGGAETMLVSLLPELQPHFEIILVTLDTNSDFDPVPCMHYSIQFSGYRSLPAAVSGLREIIKRHRPVLVRSQLYWSTIIARLATPYELPLVFSVHSVLSEDAFSKNRISLWLEKLTYRKKQTMICVSQIAQDDYQKHIRTGERCQVLHNFVDPAYFREAYTVRPHPRPLRLVAVGNLKAAKNYEFLLEVMRAAREKVEIELDIYGDGSLRSSLQATIDQHGLPVRLCGKSPQVARLLPQYDGFIMCSRYEGFGIAPAEAMAVGLPLILNDLPVFEEMSFGNAVFYKSQDVHSAVTALEAFATTTDREVLSARGRELARQHYERSAYVTKLRDLYGQAVAPAPSRRAALQF